MSPGAIDDVNAPRSMQNIVKEVMEYVKRHVEEPLPKGASYTFPQDFDTYDRALHAVWPGLFKSDPKAALLVSVSIYMDIAERWSFESAVPDKIKGLRL